jgi:hypothetical protein
MDEINSLALMWEFGVPSLEIFLDNTYEIIGDKLNE